MLTAVQTRIALTTSAENRKYRYFFLRYLMLISNLIAVAIGTPIYKGLGAIYLAAVLALTLMLALILAVLVLEEHGESQPSPCPRWTRMVWTAEHR